MALTLAQLTAARDDLLLARATGVREVRDSSGETIQYKSDSEMACALAALDAEIARAQRAPRVTYPQTSKGI